MSADRPLRILFVDTEKVWRGGQDQLFSLMTGLRQRGHEICLVAVPDAALAPKAIAEGLRVVPLSIRKSYELPAFYRLQRLLRDESFDIIHFNTPRAVFLGTLISRWRGVPVRIISRRVNFPFRSGWLSRFKYSFGIDHIITVSHSILETLLEAGVAPQKVSVVYEGIDLADFDLVPPDSDLPLDRKLIGTVSHLSEEKGHRFLIEAARRVCEAHPEALFVIVGDGPLHSSLIGLRDRLGLSKQIMFVGFREQPIALLKRFDLFVLPSLSEGLSSAIMAAMACSLPVVATRVGGIPELVSDEVTGLLVQPADSIDLATAIKSLLSQPSRAALLGRAGRERIREHFRIDVKLEQTVGIYRRLLKLKSP
ncbi:MAG: glycosyltransferase family 4 protein [Acidobacteriota bacterium]